jgi:hypothetical protein
MTCAAPDLRRPRGNPSTYQKPGEDLTYRGWYNGRRAPDKFLTRCRAAEAEWHFIVQPRAVLASPLSRERVVCERSSKPCAYQAIPRDH